MYRRKLSALLLAIACGVAVAPFAGGPAQADQPLPPPGQPVASNITSTGATLTWTAPAGPVFRFSMQQLVNGQWQGYASMPTNSFTVAGLTPGTEYTFAVQAHALAGSGYTSSPLSPPVTFRTLGAASGWDCRIQISVWSGTYAIVGTLTWRGTQPPPSWTVTFTLPLNLSVYTTWNGTLTRLGTSAGIAAPVWHPNPPTSFGVSGTFTGVWVPPSDFRVNGTPCTVQ